MSQRQDRSLPRICLDVMGSDYGPEQLVLGAFSFLKSNGKRLGKLILVGDETVLTPLLAKADSKIAGLLEVVHASQVIAMDEKPMQTLKHKKDASMFKAIDLVHTGEADAVLSCGNTGSLMAGSTLKLRTISGVDRPALASVIPTRANRFVLLDIGANPNTSVQHLVHNAILGSHFASAVLQKSRPSVGLLTIGTEEGKGTDKVQQTHECLKQLSNDSFNYKGLIEGFDLFEDAVDVVVCDGFVGNILLKTCESLFFNLKDFLKTEYKRSLVRKLGALLSVGVFRQMKQQFAPEKFSGAPLLGLNGWVFKSHGSSKAAAIAGALGMCLDCLEVYDLQAIQADIIRANRVIEGL